MHAMLHRLALLPRLSPAPRLLVGAMATHSRDLSSSSTARSPIKNVAVIGSGLMGSGIAQVSVSTSLSLSLALWSKKEVLLCVGIE